MRNNKAKKLKQFSVKSYLRPGVTQEQILQIKEVFDILDVDGGEQIDPKELKAAMTQSGFSSQIVYQMMPYLCLDTDSAQLIDFQEFLDLFTFKLSDQDTRQNINKIFGLFDDQRVGYIYMRNLRRVAKQLGQTIDDSQLNLMIQRADYDCDGLVSQEQFYNIISKKKFNY